MFVGTQAPDFLEAVTPPRAATEARRTPRPAPAAAPSAPEPARLTTPVRTGTVLVAAADTGLRALVQEALRRHGFTVLDAGPQPLQALRLAEEHRSAIDLIVVEADLRLINEEPLVKRLVPLLPSARRLLLASASTRNDARPGATPGTHWLRIPCTAAELMAHVGQALES